MPFEADEKPAVAPGSELASAKSAMSLEYVGILTTRKAWLCAQERLPDFSGVVCGVDEKKWGGDDGGRSQELERVLCPRKGRWEMAARRATWTGSEWEDGSEVKTEAEGGGRSLWLTQQRVLENWKVVEGTIWDGRLGRWGGSLDYDPAKEGAVNGGSSEI